MAIVKRVKPYWHKIRSSLPKREKKIKALILSPEGITWESVPWDDKLMPFLWVFKGKDIVVIYRKGNPDDSQQFNPFLPPNVSPKKGNPGDDLLSLTTHELYSLLDQPEVKELLKGGYGWVEKLQLGLFIALILGLGFLLFIMWSSLTGG